MARRRGRRPRGNHQPRSRHRRQNRTLWDQYNDQYYRSGAIIKIILLLLYPVLAIALPLFDALNEAVQQTTLWPKQAIGILLGNIGKLLILGISIYAVTWILPYLNTVMTQYMGVGWISETAGEALGLIEDLPNQSAQALDTLSTAGATPVYKLQCQQELATQATDNYQRDLQNCVREKQGKEPINESKNEPDWQLRGTSSFLHMELGYELLENHARLTSRCGAYCGVVQVQMQNSGRQESPDITLSDLYLTVSWQGLDTAPIYLNPASDDLTPRRERGTTQTTGSNKFYRIDHFIDGSNKAGPFVTPESLSNTEWTLRPQETRTATFLINLSSYKTYNRNQVLEAAQDKEEDIAEELEEDDDHNGKLETYCENVHGADEDSVYQGEAIAYPLETEEAEPAGNTDSFPSLAESNTETGICTQDIKDIIDNKETALFNRKTGISVDVRANYTSTTSSVFNVETTNANYWDSLSLDQREQFILSNCEPLGNGNLKKQHSFLDQQPETAVGIMMYTPCNVNYFPDGSTDDLAIPPELVNTQSVNFQAKGDNAHIKSFRITELRNINSLCNSDASDDTPSPSDVYSPEKWFGYEENSWNSPTASCRFTIPPVSESAETDRLNFDIEADFEAQTSATTSFSSIN